MTEDSAELQAEQQELFDRAKSMAAGHHHQAANGDGGVHEAKEELYHPPDSTVAAAHVKGLERYREMHARSIADPDGFWGELAANLHWNKTWSKPLCRRVISCTGSPPPVYPCRVVAGTPALSATDPQC